MDKLESNDAPTTEETKATSTEPAGDATTEPAGAQAATDPPAEGAVAPQSAAADPDTRGRKVASITPPWDFRVTVDKCSVSVANGDTATAAVAFATPEAAEAYARDLSRTLFGECDELSTGTGKTFGRKLRAFDVGKAHVRGALSDKLDPVVDQMKGAGWTLWDALQSIEMVTQWVYSDEDSQSAEALLADDAKRLLRQLNRLSAAMGILDEASDDMRATVAAMTSGAPADNPPAVYAGSEAASAKPRVRVGKKIAKNRKAKLKAAHACGEELCGMLKEVLDEEPDEQTSSLEDARNQAVVTGLNSLLAEVRGAKHDPKISAHSAAVLGLQKLRATIRDVRV